MDKPPDRGPGHPDGERRTRLIAATLLVLTAVVVAVIVFRPHPPDLSGETALADFLARAHARGLPSWIGFGLVEFSANVVMFAPLGFLGAVVMYRRNWFVVIIGFIASCAIEFIQHLLLPGRVASWSDITANTLGAFVGLLIALPALGRRARRRSRARRGVRLARDRAAISV